MGNLNIGDTILSLRKEKNITQEQLSSMVGVSAGAVCKWETGKSMPDISLLPPLARALDTSLDTLLSFKSKLSDTDVANIKKELTNIFLYNGYNEGEIKCKEYIKEYPNSIHLKLTVAGLIQMYSILSAEESNSSEDIIKSRIQYSLELFEQVAQNKDSKYSFLALFSIASLQMMLENYEESEQALRELSNSFIDPMSIFTIVLHKQGKNNEAKILCERMLLQYLNQSTAMLSTLAKVSKDEKCYDKSLLYLDAICKIENEFEFGLHSGEYSKCKLFIETKQFELASKYFKLYVNGLISSCYDYKNNHFFKDIELEVGLDGQKIIRKKLFESIIKDSDLKVLDGFSEYDQAIKMLNEAII
jgi:transcriptional regulator with XRE-family HTH domain